MDDSNFRVDMEDLLELCKLQHESLTAAIRRTYGEMSPSESLCSAHETGCNIMVAGSQLGDAVRMDQPQIIELSDHLPSFERPQPQTMTSGSDSESVCSDASSPGKVVGALNNSKSNLDGVEPYRNLRGWPLFKRLVTEYIDYLAGVLVLLNSIVMVAELEVEGQYNGNLLGLSSDPGFHDAEPVFRVLDELFVYAYTVELLLRVVTMWPHFYRSWGNWFDFVLILAGLADIYIIAPMATGGSAARNVAMLRLFRATKSLRSMRMVRTFRLFHGLRLLVKACQSFLPSLAWSMVLLGVFMSMGALIMGNLLQTFIVEEGGLLEDRIWAWKYYGTAYRSLWTLYEITFAGNWPTRARPVMDKVSNLFVIFYFCYVTVIVFAVIRVISAVFLKDTLDAAHNDEESMLELNENQKKEYIRRLEQVFRALDEGGDGLITQQRLESMLQDRKVQAYFRTLEVDVTETSALFHLLDDGDGQVTLDEFIDGILRCKGPARAIDQVAMHADIKQMDKKLSKVMRAVKASKLSVKKDKDSEGGQQAEHLKVFRLGTRKHSQHSFHRKASPF